MSLATWFGWSVTDSTGDDLPEIFPLSIRKEDFIKIDVVNIYSKILTDVLERTHGLSDDEQALLWDNCLKSESPDGLITMIAKAMYDKDDLFLIYDKAIKVIRIAKNDEAETIKKDYAAKGESKVGIFISFKNYIRSDMIKLYSALEYCTVGSLNKSMNLAKSVQIKFSEMRANVALTDASIARSQARSVAKYLSEGKDVMLDAKDIIETAKPDLTSVNSAMDFLNQKRSFYLGLPESYINGEQTGGLGTTGENDTKAIERGLKNYYFSIIKPVLSAIFGSTVTYKSQDFRQLDQALSAMQTFSLVDDTLLSSENKVRIVNQLLDIDTAEGSDA